MLPDENPAEGQQRRPSEYHDNECFIGVILVVAEQYCGTHRQSERVGGVCRKESEETASVFQDMQSAEQHLAAVAWT